MCTSLSLAVLSDLYIYHTVIFLYVSLSVVYEYDCISTYVFLSAMMRMAGSISKSTDVMKAMQNLIKIPEIQSSMMELSKEMAKVRYMYGKGRVSCM